LKETICPNCHKPIYDEEVLFCHFCGESLGRTTTKGWLGKMKYGKGKWIFVCLAAAVALGFLLLIVF